MSRWPVLRAAVLLAEVASTPGEASTTTPPTDPPSTTSPRDDPAPALAWEVVGQVPVSMTTGAVVEATDIGIVVVGTESTTVIGFDGSSTDGEQSPLPIQEAVVAAS